MTKRQGQGSTFGTAVVVGCVLALSGCPHSVRSTAHTSTAPRAAYLAADAGPDSLRLVPPPPGEGTPAFANDEAVHRAALALRGTPRWRYAMSDADLDFPHAAGIFECALDAPIDEASTPRLYALLRNSMVDAGRSTRGAKDRYTRVRPFALHDEASCVPADEAGLRRNGSYPSGHAAIGWAWALTLAEIAPAQADAVLARGRAFGESRLVCNVHWQSDVLEGRLLGAATVARLHDVAAYREDVAAARGEVARAQAQHRKPARDCAAEASALQQTIDGVL